MYYTKQQLAVVEGCSKDETRPALNGVYFAPDGRTIATDGHLLFRTPPSGVDVADYPKVSANPVNPNGEILPAETVRAMSKAIPNTRMGLPILNGCILAGDNGTRKLITTNLDTETCLNARLIDGPYPNMDTVWPTADRTPLLTIRLNAKLLKRVCDFAIKANPDDFYNLIDLTFYDDTSAMVFVVGNNVADGLLMPHRKTERY